MPIFLGRQKKLRTVQRSNSFPERQSITQTKAAGAPMVGGFL